MPLEERYLMAVRVLEARYGRNAASRVRVSRFESSGLAKRQGHRGIAKPAIDLLVRGWIGGHSCRFRRHKTLVSTAACNASARGHDDGLEDFGAATYKEECDARDLSL